MPSEGMEGVRGGASEVAIKAHFHDVWWTCSNCHETFPRDYGPDYCPGDCNVRLRRNDDIRIALMEAQP